MHKPIILASASPRRREILKQVGVPFQVLTSDVDESYDSALPAPEIVKLLALRKGRAVAAQAAQKDALVLSADTLVCLDGKILGKPASRWEGMAMLRLLSGKTHSVFTGFALISRDKTVTDVCETKVTIRSLTEQEIEEYLNTGEYADKAGGYGIQGIAAKFVESISGDFYNVVGLPVCRVIDRMNKEF